MKRIAVVIVLVMVFCGFLKAQDAHFSQYFAAPLYLSPSMAGATGSSNATINYRNMWPGVKTAYQTYAASADFYLPHYNSGFGVLLTQDKAGSAGLTNTFVGGQYSYRLTINREWQVVPAFQCGVGESALDFGSLIFADELNESRTQDSYNQLDETGSEKKPYFDLAVSVLAASEKFWGGVTVNHITEPDYSFLGVDAKLSLKTVCFGGYNVWTERVRRGPARTVSLNWRYEMQEKFEQLDVGFYWYNEHLDYGIWYRGIPGISSKSKLNMNNRDAFIFIAQFKTSSVKIGYSYDLTVSDLAAQATGAHEISLNFNIARLNLVKRITTTSLSCFPTGKDGRYYTRGRRRVIR